MKSGMIIKSSNFLATSALKKPQREKKKPISNAKNRVNQWRLKDGSRTAVYFIYTGETWPGGPDLMVSFGMTGACNLIWAYLIRTRFPHFLDSYRIVAAEILIGNIPDQIEDLSFVEDWDVKIMLDHKL